MIQAFALHPADIPLDGFNPCYLHDLLMLTPATWAFGSLPKVDPADHVLSKSDNAEWWRSGE